MVKIEIGPGPETLVKVRLGDRDWLITGTAGNARLAKAYENDPLRAQIIAFAPDTNTLISLYSPSTVAEHPNDFNPIGISYIPKNQSSGDLYVINEIKGPKKGVLCFHLSLQEDQGKRTLPTLIPQAIPHIPYLSKERLNSIAACRDGSFYISTFYLSPFPRREGSQPNVKDQEKEKPKDSVYRYDPKGAGQWSRVAGNIGGANGLALSPDKEYLFVSAYYQRCVWRFKRNTKTGTLSDPYKIKLKAFPDNLTVDQNILYITAQTHLLKTGLHVLLSPHLSHLPFQSKAQVYTHSIEAQASAQFSEPSQAMLSITIPDDYQAASTCVKLGDSFFISQIMGNHLLKLRKTDDSLQSVQFKRSSLE